MNNLSLSSTAVLANGVKMPKVGLGVFKVEKEEELITAVKSAIEIGYRSIDTASIYGNEEWVGEAIRQSGINREELFITSKVWNSDQGYEAALKAFNTSLEKMGLEYLDLYLIHWPVEGKYTETWRALEDLYKEGKIKTIGVSNFQIRHLESLLKTAEIKPMINQIELHPKLAQTDLRAFAAKYDMHIEAWAPLMQGGLFENEILKKLAEKHGKSIAQIVLRWHLQNSIIVIPKSTKPHRIKENADLFDFELSQQDMELIDSLDEHLRVGPDPDNFDF
ncbi:diketogulonate reductase-like aldo/keto reductase [Cytobacillus firmus]|uniref:Diketogulonate reductase-like aldo/keto reductase n=2 Tax=Cytobacillus TaxID=2675230 RepID=A0A366JLB1_CYTFI|nr:MULTISPECIES: aldo/keto reductase [Cytobacillus]RBP88386.1 diketogulonate reductase-like aldo/keto reductase [Cytobacillus firmus]TDX38460.1 diketogulonate reductase-like aldo/keto reductase [Cytobacillus oceanisediminis]